MQKLLEHKTVLFAAGVLALVFAVIDLTRPALPVDETRYLTVAWEFFTRGEYVLPTLNFLPYHHKPPMLFWLIDGMWHIFGVHVWAARFVPYVAALAVLFLTGAIAKRLFPDVQPIRSLSILLVMGGLPFVIYSPVIAFDWLLTSTVLIGIYGLIAAMQTGAVRYWFLYGVAMGLGVLVKGPVVLLHLLFPAVLAPVWKQKNWPFSVRDWLSGIVMGILIAAGIGLSWATPAAIIGGPDYAHMIFFGQTAGRVVDSFDHARPVWWFLVLLPAYFVPWIFWPRVWTVAKSIKGITLNSSYRFLLCWFVPIFISFSLISGKQIHYLFPILPAASILLAGLLVQNHVDPSRMIRVAGRFVMGAAALVVIVHLGASNHLHKYYSLNEIADAVAKAQSEGRPIAIARLYHGEIGYLAQLKQTMTPFTEIQDVRDWIKKNPKGIVVTRYRDRSLYEGFNVIAEKPYRSEGSYFAVLEKGSP